MSTISNFLLANLAERLTPLLQTPVEDIVYEILDRKGLPTRSEIRDLKNRLERIDEEVKELTEQLARAREQAAAVKAAPAPAKAAEPKAAKPKAAKPKATKPKAAKAEPAAAEPAAPKRRGRPPRQGPPPECTAADCILPVRSKGLCAKHYQSWRRGRLEGFVSPDGFVLVDGKRVKLDKRYAGAPVTAKIAGAEVLIGVKGKELKRKLPKETTKRRKAAPKKAAPKKAAPKKAAPKKAAPKKTAPKKSGRKPAAKKGKAKKA